jgi:cytochrome b
MYFSAPVHEAKIGSSSPSAEEGGPGKEIPAWIQVWDPFVRIFHWTLVLSCFLDLFLLEGGEKPHNYIGYAAAALVGMRVVWGVIGSRHARFVDFVPTPSRLLDYLWALSRGREPRHLGHNPAGGVMILGLLAVVLALGITGWMTTLDHFWGAEWLEELHEAFADALLVMVLLHAGAAVLESFRHRENLIWSMVTGKKRP